MKGLVLTSSTVRLVTGRRHAGDGVEGLEGGRLPEADEQVLIENARSLEQRIAAIADFDGGVLEALALAHRSGAVGHNFALTPRTTPAGSSRGGFSASALRELR